MPNQVLHARLSLPDGTTFEDTASIGFTVQSSSAAPIPPADVVSWIDGIMNRTVVGQTAAICTYISPQVLRGVNGCPVEIYDVTDHLDGSPAGSPVSISSITLGASTGSIALPAQLALVVGYRSAYGTDLEKGVTETAKSTESAIDQGAPATHSAISKPRARDRGRLFLGPLHTNDLAGTAGNAGVASVALYDDVLTQITSAFGTQVFSDSGSFNPVVWSRVAAAVKPIAFVAIDAALGVIRKRADTVINRVLSWSPIGAP